MNNHSGSAAAEHAARILSIQLVFSMPTWPVVFRSSAFNSTAGSALVQQRITNMQTSTGGWQVLASFGLPTCAFD